MNNRLSASRLGQYFILIGVLLLVSSGAYLANSLLLVMQVENQQYLLSSARLMLPLPDEQEIAGIARSLAAPAHLVQVQPEPVVEPARPESIKITQPAISPTTAAATVTILEPTAESAQITLMPTFEIQPEITQIPASAYRQPTATPLPTMTPAPVEPPQSSPIVRLVIPSINIDRGVIFVEPSDGENGDLGWNTDVLFANKKRKDLVGQLSISVNPGEGSNIILVGHNFNEGFQLWNGVFKNLQNIDIGDEIMVETENGSQIVYQVHEVQMLPWKKMNPKELARHQQFLWPTPSEQLTLITCGGSYINSWSHRIYVAALPVQP